MIGRSVILALCLLAAGRLPVAQAQDAPDWAINPAEVGAALPEYTLFSGPTLADAPELASYSFQYVPADAEDQSVQLTVTTDRYGGETAEKNAGMDPTTLLTIASTSSGAAVIDGMADWGLIDGPDYGQGACWVSASSRGEQDVYSVAIRLDADTVGDIVLLAPAGQMDPAAFIDLVGRIAAQASVLQRD